MVVLDAHPEVAVGSIRPRILKASARMAAVPGSSRGCSGLDPTEDTESWGQDPSWPRSPGVAVGSIRPRILKDPPRRERHPPRPHPVAVGSIRPRILKVEKHEGDRGDVIRSCSGLDPTEDTERRLVASNRE